MNEPTNSNVVRRENLFQKGQSGNPAGPASSKIKFEGKLTPEELYRTKALEAAEILYALMKGRKTPPHIKLAAIKEWNDRAYGKAPSRTYVETPPETETKIDVTKLDKATLKKIAAAANKAD